jgi:hypothetical protein
MKKVISGCILVGFLLLITHCVNSIEYQNQKSKNISENQKIENPTFFKNIVLTPFWGFCIAFGDFYVDGNFLMGHVDFAFEYYMNLFVFPEIHIFTDTECMSYIHYYDCFYYKMIYTNHSAFMLLIQLKPPSTPQVGFSSNSILDRLTVTWADANTKWSDIQVILDKPGATYQVFAINGTAIAPVNNTNLAGVTEVNKGDYIQLSTYSGNVTVTLMYIPFSSLLGRYPVDV